MPVNSWWPSVPALVLAGLTATAAVCSWAPDLYQAARSSIRDAWRSLQQAHMQSHTSPATAIKGAANERLPECQPIPSLEALLAWRRPACELHADPCAASVPLNTHLCPQDSERPRLLVCHDMQGGYLQDRWPQGVATAEGYRLWHWDAVDVFCYFSHHLVTIPPAGWINAAHTHGVQVLGTFITEGAEGAALCRKAFSSRATAEALADQLVSISQHYGFEGWLVNIENSLGKTQVAVLLHFLAYLRARMRACVAHSLVIWYDAVTVQGHLTWQNDVTPLNAPFFDAVDAIFLNYHWTEATPARSAAAAGRRKAEVFLGVDVHGRGTYGGGKDRSHVAVTAARAAGVSVALFAPAWLLENHDRADFEQRQDCWWQQVQQAWGQQRTVAHALPFASSFNIGCGSAMFLAGDIVSSSCWFNLSAQTLLPRLAHQGVHAKITMATAFHGGSCLELKQSSAGDQASPIWLYRTHLPIPTNGIAVTCTVAVGDSGADIGLILALDRGSDSSIGSDSHVGGSSGHRSLKPGQLLLLLPPGSLPGAPDGAGPWQLPPGLPPGVTVLRTAEFSIGRPVQVCQPRAGSSTTDSAISSKRPAFHWVTRSWSVPARPVQHQHVTAVGVVLLHNHSSGPICSQGAPSPESGESFICQADAPVLLGHVCIREQMQPDMQLQEPTLVQLHASHLRLQHHAAPASAELLNAPGTAADTGHAVLLSCQLTWRTQPGAACHSFHVWAGVDAPATALPTPSAAAAAASASLQHRVAPGVQDCCWRWVGQAFADSFYVHDLPLACASIGTLLPTVSGQPTSPQQQQQQQQQRHSVTFAVEPEGYTGCSQPLMHAATVTVVLPDVTGTDKSAEQDAATQQGLR